MNYSYQTSPEVCSSSIELELSDSGVIEKVEFIGGCPGSLQAVSRLVVGKKAADAAKILKGIPCGGKSTSCPDQLARALIRLMNEHPQWQER